MKKTLDQELNQFHYLIEEQVNARTQELLKENRLLKKEIYEFRSTEEIYRQLIVMANDAIFVADAENGIIIGANQKASILLGLPVEKIIGMHQSQLHPKEDAERYTGIFRDHIESGEAITDDVFIIRSNGSRIPVEISASVTEFKGRKVIQGIFRDVTERWRIEKLLKKSEEKFRAYYEKAPLAYQSLDENGCLIHVNVAWLNIMQYSHAEVLGESIANFLAPEYVELFRKKFPCFKQEGEIQGLEFKMVRKDGLVLTMSVTGQIGYDNEGNFIRTHCILNNITECRKLEKEALEIEDRERKRIACELHDGLGQLLTSLAYKSEALQYELEEESVNKSEDAASITSDINKAKEEVDRILKGISPVDPDEKGFVAALENLAYSTKVNFRISCNFRYEAEISINDSAVISHLYRIAQEAVTNAVKHSRCRNIDIILQKERDGKSLMIKDDGVGIPLSGNRDGMGLKIMKYRAALIGASLDIQSDAGTETSIKCSVVDTPLAGESDNR